MNDGSASNPKKYNIESETFTLNIPVKDGYTFIGWTKEGSDVLIPSVTISKGSYGDLTYTANFSNNTNQIIFDKNNGLATGEMSNQSIDTDRTAVLKENVYALEGYTFIGWSTSKDGEAIYSDKDEYTMGKEPSYTLYALWSPNTNTKYSVKYYFQNINNDEYTLDETKTENLTGSTDTLASVNPAVVAGYSVDEVLSNLSDNIDGDGSQILNVYYLCNKTFNGLKYQIIDNKAVLAECLKSTENALIPSKVTVVGIEYDVTSINADAFDGATSLKTLSIDENISLIPFGLLEGNTSIEELILYCMGEKQDSPTYTNIGFIFGASDYTKHLEFVPQSLKKVAVTKETAIAANSFRDCTGLMEVAIPNTVSSIGITSFMNCTSLTKLSIPFTGGNISAKTGSLKLFGYIFGTTINDDCTPAYQIYSETNGNWSNYYIPTSLKEVIITLDTEIPDYAFINCSTLETITLLDTTTYIGTRTFEGCKMLANFSIPSAVSEIKEGSFRNCISLTSFTTNEIMTAVGNSAYQGCTGITRINLLDNKVLTILGSNAFSGCTSLTEVEVPNTITSIGEASFADCVGLTKLSIPFTGNNINAASGSTKLFGYIFGTTSNDGCTPAYQIYSEINGYWKNYYIPNNLVEVTISLDTVIPNYAFIDCKLLKIINFLDTTTIFGVRTFDGCNSLLDFSLPSSLITIENGAFQNCTSLTEVTIPDTVTTIGNSAYLGCAKLKEINMPEGGALATIKASAFSGCVCLTEVVIPNTVTAIEAYILNGCISMTKLTTPFVGSKISAYNGEGKLLGYMFGTTNAEGTTAVNQLYSNDNGYWKDFYIPTCLKEVVITLDTDITNNVFTNCTMLEKVTMLDTVTSIGDSAFKNCTSLLDFSLPTSLISIGSETFSGCTTLEVVTIPDAITTIGNSAYLGCTKLKEINMPEGGALITLEQNAFNGCTSLTEVTIPNTVTSIGTCIFKGCTSLNKLNTPFVGSNINAYNGEGKLLGYMFGSEALEGTTAAYQIYSNDYGYWRNYYISTSLKEVVITLDTSIPGYAFVNCVTLEKITIPLLASADDTAFSGCLAVIERA